MLVSLQLFVKIIRGKRGGLRLALAASLECRQMTVDSCPMLFQRIVSDGSLPSSLDFDSGNRSLSTRLAIH